MQKFPKFNFISVIWNYLKHPDASTGRGKNFVDKRQIKTFILQLSNQFLPAFFFYSEFILRLKRFFMMHFLETIASPNLTTFTCWRKNWRSSPAQPWDLPSKSRAALTALTFFLRVSWGQKHQKLKYWLLLKSGDFIKTLFLKT